MLNQKSVDKTAMTPKQIELIRETWNKVVPIADDAARMFYQRLFEIDPGTKLLFANTDMTQQHGKLLKALGLVVENADQTENLIPVLEELGRRHVRYGVEDRHYDSVGAALIWTLEQGLGAAFTEAVRSAWTNAYALVSDTMRRAAGEVARATAPRSPLSRAALVVCLTLGAAGGLTAITAPMATPQAHAFGWSDVTGAAKDWGTSAVDGVKRAGESVGSAARKVGNDVADNARDFGAATKRDAKKIGGFAKDVGKDVAENARDFGAATKRDAKKIGGFAKGLGKDVAENARDFGAATARDAKKIGGFAKDAATAVHDHNLIRTAVNPWLLGPNGLIGISCGDLRGFGKLGCDFEPGGLSSTPVEKPTPPAAGPGSGDGPSKNPGGFNGPIKGTPDTSRIARKGPATGFAAKSLKSRTGNEVVPIKTGGRGNEVVPIKRGERGNEVVPIKRGERGNEVVPIKRGERGNEVVPIKTGGRGNEIVPIRRGGSDAPVPGITRENLNLKPDHGRKARNPIARDRSVRGRPVGIKRPDAKSQPKVEPVIRDHRPGRETKPIIRDHRPGRETKPIIRDHRPGRATRPIVRDRRAKNTAQRVIVKDRRGGAAARRAVRGDNRSSTRKSSSRRAPASSRIIRSNRGNSRVRTIDRRG